MGKKHHEIMVMEFHEAKELEHYNCKQIIWLNDNLQYQSSQIITKLENNFDNMNQTIESEFYSTRNDILIWGKQLIQKLGNQWKK
jgi:uncharacterized protein Yka (UPF0111/DUF47 family)